MPRKFMPAKAKQKQKVEGGVQIDELTNSQCVVVGRRSHHANLQHAKKDLEMEKIRSPNDAWKGYLKT